MRARTRAVVVSAGVALVAIPISGATAVAISGEGNGTLVTPRVVADALVFADAELYAEVAPILADGEIDFAGQNISVEVIPQPTRRAGNGGSGGARAVANSADVAQAVASGDVLSIARAFIGTPYKSGGKTPAGFDCSGFVSYVYAQLGISLPGTSGAYYNVGTRVDSPLPGDIIVTPGHVAIYAGNGKQIDAPVPGKTVQERGIWQKNPVYIRVS